MEKDLKNEVKIRIPNFSINKKLLLDIEEKKDDKQILLEEILESEKQYVFSTINRIKNNSAIALEFFEA